MISPKPDFVITIANDEVVVVTAPWPREQEVTIEKKKKKKKHQHNHKLAGGWGIRPKQRGR